MSEVGLLDKEDDDQFQIIQQIDEATQNVLAVYVDDVAKKLPAFLYELSGKLEFLRRIVNKRFMFKRMDIDREKGLYSTTSKGAL